MQIQTFVKPGFYKDSVALMRVAQALLADFTLDRATLVMATPANKEILAEAGLLQANAQAAGPADLLIVIAGDEAAEVAAATAQAHVLLEAKPAHSDSAQAIAPKTLVMGQHRMTDDGVAANLAQISVPGPYAAAEGLKAIKQGMHVFMFSDNVPLAQEVALKRAAQAKGLLVMGPDCGTAIINGVPLGFANVVRRGAIGFVAASGTGLQEVTTGVHNEGLGVSHALGTGGRDTGADVGGITMLQALDLLIADAQTEVIGIVSKPPAPSVAAAVYAKLQAGGKPAVVLFLGDTAHSTLPNVHTVRTLEGATAVCAQLARGEVRGEAIHVHANVTLDDIDAIEDTSTSLPVIDFAPGQRYLRGLYSGGTFCTEAQLVASESGIVAWSNVPVDKKRALKDIHTSQEHTLVDLGDDAFTVGKPHPMIDQGTRIARLLHEAHDPSVAVILLDVVIGYGAHADPAGELVPHIRAAQALAVATGRTLAFVAFVCGTEDDPQVRSVQEKTLLSAGVLVAVNSTQAARLAASLVASAVAPPQA